MGERLLHDREAGADNAEIGLDQGPHASRDKIVGYVCFVLDRAGNSSGAKYTCDGNTEGRVSTEFAEVIEVSILTIHQVGKFQRATAFPEASAVV